MLPHALAEQLIIHSNRSVSRTNHGLIAPRFASNDVKNSIAYRGVVLWNAIGRNLVPRVLSYPPYGAVGENPGNEVGRSNGSILHCTDMKSLLKKVVKYCSFSDFNFNVLVPQKINNRSENFLYF